MGNDTIGKKVDEYLRLLGDIKKKTGDESVALVILQQVMKDVRGARIHEERSNKANGFQLSIPATAGQLAYLKKLGAETPEGLSKMEASDLIDKLKESRSDSLLNSEEMLNKWYASMLEPVAL